MSTSTTHGAPVRRNSSVSGSTDGTSGSEKSSAKQNLHGSEGSGKHTETVVTGSSSSDFEDTWVSSESTGTSRPRVSVVDTTTANSTPTSSTATTTTTTNRRTKLLASAGPVPKNFKQTGKNPPPASILHSMPTYTAPPTGNVTPESTTVSLSKAIQRAPGKKVTIADTPSPRSRSAIQPVRTPRLPPQSPRARQPRPDDVADRNFKAAQLAATAIVEIRGKAARLSAFQSVLSQAAAIAPAARGPVLEALAVSLNSVSEPDKGPCLAELRALCADMGPEFRRKYLVQLLKVFIVNRDSDDAASDPDMVFDAARFNDQYANLADRLNEMHALLTPPVSAASMARLQKQIAHTGVSHNDRSALVHLIMLLEPLDAAVQKQIVAMFESAGLKWATVAAALFQSPYMEQMEKLAKSSASSLSSLFLGTLAAEAPATQKLLLILGRIALPEALHVYLCEQIGMTRRAAPPAQTTESEAGALLRDTVALFEMSEARRCMLIHSLSVVDDSALYLALTGGELNDARDYLAYAHQVIAGVIDVGTCHALTSAGGADVKLASYSARAAEMLKHDTAQAIVRIGKCDFDKVQLRSLMLKSTDTKKMKDAVFNVLDSDLSFDEKLDLLKCETTPVGQSVGSHVNEVSYKTARTLYLKKYPGRKHKTLDYLHVENDEKKYRSEYKKLTSALEPDGIADIKDAARRAMKVAKSSRLPAMHVNAGEGNAVRITAYMETVAGFRDVLPPAEIAAYLALARKDMPLFHYAMMRGTAHVIQACVSIILASELPTETKISFLEARRAPDNLGALYMAMYMGYQDQMTAFVKTILEDSQISLATKIELLQCAKIARPDKADLEKSALEAWEQSGPTARFVAEQRNHQKLVKQFDYLVEHSNLSIEQKNKLQTS